MVNGPLYHRSAAESSQPQKKQEKELKNQKDWEKKEKDAIKKFKVSKCILYIYILGVTLNCRRFDASIGGAWVDSQSHSGIFAGFYDHAILGIWDAQMSDFTENISGYLCNHGYIHTKTQLVGRRQPMTSLPAKPQYKRAPGEYFIHFFVWSLRPKHGTVPRGRSVSFHTRGTIVT